MGFGNLRIKIQIQVKSKPKRKAISKENLRCRNDSQMLPNIYITEKQPGRDVKHHRRQPILAAGLDIFTSGGFLLFF